MGVSWWLVEIKILQNFLTMSVSCMQLCNIIILFVYTVQVKSNTNISVYENIKGICYLWLQTLKISYMRINAISKEVKKLLVYIHNQYVLSTEF